MAKQTVAELIMHALEATKVELDDAQKELLTSKLDGLSLTDVDPKNILKEGHVAVDETFWNSQRSDLKDYKKALKDEKAAHEDLKDTLASGGATEKVLIDKLKTRIKELEPINQLLMKEARTRWEAKEKVVPEKAQPLFHAPEKEGAELSDAQVMENLAKHTELSEAGFLGEVKPEETGTGTPVIGHGQSQRADDSVLAKPPTERMAAGYGKMTESNTTEKE